MRPREKKDSLNVCMDVRHLFRIWGLVAEVCESSWLQETHLPSSRENLVPLRTEKTQPARKVRARWEGAACPKIQGAKLSRKLLGHVFAEKRSL